MKRLAAILLCMTLLLGACGKAPEAPSGAGGSTKRAPVSSMELQFAAPEQGAPVATIQTNMGAIHVVLYPQKAPIAVQNFTGLAQQGYYTNSLFHRVEKDFLIQGGDPSGTGLGGSSLWGKPFGIERSENLRHYAGALCMAAAEGENNSQFYILASPQTSVTDEIAAQMRAAGIREEVIATYQQAGGEPYLDNTDTVFGQVYAGMDIVDAISRHAVNEAMRPLNDVIILSVTIGTYTSSSTEPASAPSAPPEESPSEETSLAE